MMERLGEQGSAALDEEDGHDPTGTQGPNGTHPDGVSRRRASLLDEKDWLLLIKSINRGTCTPFLGSEVCSSSVPLRSTIAQRWAGEYGYPLEDSDNLARVAQFVDTEYDSMFPKYEIVEQYRRFECPKFGDPNEPHRILAGLPLPVYITTNYDDFMLRALKSQNKDARQEICRWNEYLMGHPSVFDTGFEPTVANPVVFHLHGCTDVPQSLVLTEDDYLDFLVSISRSSANRTPIPPFIEDRFTSASLLFLGYAMQDLDFRVVLRGLVSHLKRSLGGSHVSVQFVAVGHTVKEEQIERAEAYLSRYCGRLNIRVYWGKCQDFIMELKERWQAAQSD